MLMLPIILWWADAPLRFAMGRSRTIVSAFCVAGLFTSLLLGSSAYAEDRSGTIKSVADSPFARASGDWTIKSRSESDPSLRREGTKIPPTHGRIVMMGRRWAFMPNSFREANAADPNVTRWEKDEAISMFSKPRLVSTKASEDAQGNAPEISGGDQRRGRLNRTFGEIRFVSSPLASKSQADASGDSNGAVLIAEQQKQSERKPWVLVENLMLQRIVESVRADNNDDRWILSGQVNEFFGENRMVIQTAHRSDQN